MGQAGEERGRVEIRCEECRPIDGFWEGERAGVIVGVGEIAT